MTQKRPNIVLMFSDQHAQPYLGCSGDPIASTPNLDRLARNGVTFENTYCPSPLCIPSRMAFMTGQYPSDIGVYTNRDYLPSDTPTFAHALSAAGYRTVLAGRMHFIGPDQTHGFDDHTVGDISIGWPGAPLIKFGDLNKARGTKGPTLKHAGYGETAVHRYDAAVTEGALSFIQEAAQDSGSDDPFCLVVGWYGPHPPFIAPEEDYRHFEGRVPAPRLHPPKRENEHPFVQDWRERAEFIDLPEDDVIRARTAYYGLIRMIDRMAGRVMDAVEATGMLDNTLLVYASDHGEQLGERGLWQKSTFHDHSAKVPLIMSWPNILPAGEKRSQVVNLTDLAATFVDAGGGTPLPHGRGDSLLQVATNNGSWEKPTFSEFYGGLVSIETTSIVNRMVRAGKWKLNYYHGYPPELFDMYQDPDETVNLASDEKHKDIVAQLEEMILRDWNPVRIAEAIERKQADVEILKQWTKVTQPVETHRWVDPEPDRNWTSADGEDRR